MSEYRCPKHPEIELWNVLAGGAGWCSRCFAYIQAAGIPEPLRDRPALTLKEWNAAKRRAAKDGKAKTATKAKPVVEATQLEATAKPKARLIKRDAGIASAN